MSDATPGRRSAPATRPVGACRRRSCSPSSCPCSRSARSRWCAPSSREAAARPPELTELTRVSLGCPSSAGGDSPRLAVGSVLADGGRPGQPSTSSGPAAPPRPVDLRPGRVSSAPGPRGGRGDRRGRRWRRACWPPAWATAPATACGGPLPEAWFPGVGRPAGPRVGDRAGQPRPGPGHRRPDDPGPQRPAGRARGPRHPGARAQQHPAGPGPHHPAAHRARGAGRGVPRPAGQLGARHRRRARHRDPPRRTG